LENAGLLFQPHTSAGRIPSDFGYRVYVNELLEPPALLAQSMTEALSSAMDSHSYHSLESLLQGASRILASLSGYVAMVTAPRGQNLHIRHLQLVAIDDRRAMLIVVTDSYHTQSLIVDLPEATHAEELELLNNFLNATLTKQPLTDLSTQQLGELHREFSQWADFVRGLFDRIRQAIAKPQTEQIFISGVHAVLSQPEFLDPYRVKALVSLLEEQREELGSLIAPHDFTAQSKVMIRIGSENPLEPMQACTLVSQTYEHDGVPVGSVSILGPTRLQYDRAIASVQATAGHLTAALSSKNPMPKTEAAQAEMSKKVSIPKEVIKNPTKPKQKN
jgi:heat-inducible transcriptional repressor